METRSSQEAGLASPAASLEVARTLHQSVGPRRPEHRGRLPSPFRDWELSLPVRQVRRSKMLVLGEKTLNPRRAEKRIGSSLRGGNSRTFKRRWKLSFLAATASCLCLAVDRGAFILCGVAEQEKPAGFCAGQPVRSAACGYGRHPARRLSAPADVRPPTASPPSGEVPWLMQLLVLLRCRPSP